MTHYIGIDIGGTKIAGGVFSESGELLVQKVIPTPKAYDAFLDGVTSLALFLENEVGASCKVGIGIVGAINHAKGRIQRSGHLPHLKDQPLFDDLKNRLGRDIRFANDANCNALAEALDGAGQGYDIVVGLIMGTGIGAGLVINGRIVDGPNGLTGEFGQVSMPRYPNDRLNLRVGPCGQLGVVEGHIKGSALEDLYKEMTGRIASPKEIGVLMVQGDESAKRVMDEYYDQFAKAMSVIIQTFDPHIIVASGGLANLPGLFEEVPKRWAQYTVVEEVNTRFVHAKHTDNASMRGAAWLWR